MGERFVPPQVVKKEQIPERLAEPGQLRALQQKIKELPQDFLTNFTEHLENHDETINYLVDLSGNLAEQFSELIQISNKDDKQLPLIQKLHVLMNSLRVDLPDLRQYTLETKNKMAGEQALSADEIKTRELALKDVKRNLKQVFEAVRAWDVKAPATVTLAKKIITGLVTFLTMGGIFKTDSRYENTMDKVRASEVKPKKEKPKRVRRLHDYKEYGYRDVKSEAKLGRAHPGEKTSSNINDPERDGEPGELKQGPRLAKIDFPFFSDIKDSLWVTDVSARGQDGEFRVVTEEAQAVGADTEATVTTEEMPVVSGQEVALPAPIGFKVGEVKLDGSAVPYKFNQDLHELTFAGSGKVKIVYTVVRAVEKFGLEEPVGLDDVARSMPEQAVIAALKEDVKGERTAEIINSYLGDFTYVVSDQMQALLDYLPGTMDEKVGGVRIGDCDVLTMHVAGILNDAGKPAAMASGLVEKNDELAGPGHAKLVYFGEDSQPRTFEATAATKKQIIHLKFSNEDRMALANIATSEEPETPEQRLALYEKFRVELERIMQKDEYKKFESHGGTASERLDSAERALNAVTKGWGDLWHGPDWQSMLLALAMLMLGGGGLVGGIKITESRATRKFKKRQGDVVGLLKDELDAAGERVLVAEGEEADFAGKIQRKIEEHYRINPDLEKILPILEVLKLQPKKQEELVGAFAMLELFHIEPYHFLNFFPMLLQQPKWRRAMEILKKEGFKADNIIAAAKEVMVNPKLRAEYEAGIPERAKDITEEASKWMVKTLRPGKENISSRMPKLSELFGELGVRRINGPDLPEAQPTLARGEVHSLVPYLPGMDARAINWKATARAGKPIAQRSPEVPFIEQAKVNLNVVVDVANIERSELVHLAALIFYAQTFPRELRIDSFRFVANGKEINLNFNQNFVHALTSRNGGGVAVRALVEAIERAKLEEAITPFMTYRQLERSQNGDEFRSFTQSLIPEAVRNNKGVLFVATSWSSKYLREQFASHPDWRTPNGFMTMGDKNEKNSTRPAELVD